ncbi:cell envelope integrity protein TolA [Altericroceibacterium endophyticum]|uniref:Uncharacterized protein n=1 Tax=Altericroceibacterium endophyticum TaxID=1808508 RepID=A0A6I4T8Z9_9SPHN|nr:cell envelope integrity protein TolA [Altericroceibacterium endophyticum]MXO67178.1 hypothetical protein [Altericroceibacterium endophyticum]
MKKSTVAGIAGSVRCIPLTLTDLYHQERHGKRLDKTSKARVIRDILPITTTGLELRDLYNAHVEGCFIPKGKTKVIHAIIQWPKDLVDPNDEGWMLRHGIAFAKRVWGEDSIVAARYDRDEKSAAVVDLFLVPKYRKYTKTDPNGKLAVSITKHGKDLAKRLSRMTGKSKKGEPQASPWDVGMALQDELYMYMRDVIRLEGVARGQKKEAPGPDWKSSEQLRTQELDQRDAALYVRKQELDDRKQELDDRQQQIQIDTAVAQAKSKKCVDDAEALAQKIILAASEHVAKWKAEAEVLGREVGYEAGFQEGQAKLKEEQEAASKAKAAAEQNNRESKKALDTAMDERHQAELLRNEAESDAHAIRAKAKQEAASQHAALAQRQVAIEAGLEALLKGEIENDKSIGNHRRTLAFRTDLPSEKKDHLEKTITPAWYWLSCQAERLADITYRRVKAREAQLDACQVSLDDRERNLMKTSLRQEAQKRELAQSWKDLNSLTEKASAAKLAFQDAIAPITGWIHKFEEARGPVRQVMEIAPQRKIAEAALAEPAIQAAQAADADITRGWWRSKR